jgi:hypothetical protein
MLKLLAACAAGVVCLAGCASSIALPTSSSSGVPPADSPAASVRARMVLLAGEHTYTIAKLAAAAEAGRKDEFHSYAGLLATVGADLTNALTKAVGETEGQQFGQGWILGDSFTVDYMVAAITHQQDLADAAMINLNDDYVPQLAQAISSPLNIPMSTATKLVTDQVNATKQLIDDAAAGTPTAFYTDVRAAYAKSIAMGGALAEAIVWKFADKYPGDATGPGAKLRAQLDATLQEHAYLVSMATDAEASGATTDAGAAESGLQANTAELSRVVGSIFGTPAGTQAGQLWGGEDASFVAYASASDDASRTAALNMLNQTSTPGLASFLDGLHVSADFASVTHQTIGVIDDQRAKSYGVIAAEDRQSAALLVSIGDLMMDAPTG